MNSFDLKNPETHPSRYHDCVNKLFSVTTAMTQEERLGAAKVLNALADYFWQAHFEKKAVLNQKSLVKTLDEIRENVMNEFHHNDSPLWQERQQPQQISIQR
jgi:hypothetical protein